MRFENCCPFLVYRLGVFVNRVMRKIFGPKRIKATGKCRLHKEEFNDLHSPTNIIRLYSHVSLSAAADNDTCE